MKLAAVLKDVEADSPETINGRQMRQLGCDSRKVAAGLAVFCAARSEDGRQRFCEASGGAGATAIVSEERQPADLPEKVLWIRVREARKSLAIAAANFFGHPGQALKMAAVTGTNGKTTTTSIIDSIIKASGAKTGLFGTIAYHTPAGDYPAPNTTPESVDLQGFLAEIRDNGGQYAVLEASSHALSLDRLWTCHFAAAVFTNLTREHMDYHKNFDDYFAAKRRLFDGTGAGVPDAAIINIDDEYGKRLAGMRKM